ncbi:HsdM family class I SAM-dependent methyltransferase [Ralstonia sp. VS2407]
MEKAQDKTEQSLAEDSLPSAHHISHRRVIGAFYTPLDVTTLLCDWGIRARDELVLEPCFGGCTFIEASLAKLHALGHRQPEKNIFGYDIDPLAFRFLSDRIDEPVVSKNFVACDFIKASPENARHALVDVVIGNPPYIRHSRFSPEQQKSLKDWKEKYAFNLNGRSSLWAYFVIHAMNFLKRGGRVAWVLPGSFLTAKYSEKIRNELLKKFSRVAALTLTQRLFKSEGTEELTVILLAEGYEEGEENAVLESCCLENVRDLKEYISNWCVRKISLINSGFSGSGVVPSEAVSLVSRLSGHRNVKKFGDLVDTEIGVVSGNSKYFIKGASAWGELGIDKKYLQYIAPRSLWIRGVVLGSNDAVEHEQQEVPCFALNSPPTPRSNSLKSYLDSYRDDDIQSNSTFARRDPWFQFLDDKIPNAFLIFMAGLGPRLVVNDIGANCTNSLYRVHVRESTAESIKSLAIALVSTFSQLSAEILGHGRGSGALKLEPGDAARLLLYLPKRSRTEENSVFSQIDKLYRENQFDRAREAADSYLFRDAPDLMSAMPVLSEALFVARKRRAGNR